MDNTDLIKILESVKEIKTLGGTEFVTVQMTADYFGVDKGTIDVLILRNKEELEENGLKNYKRKEIGEIFEKINNLSIQTGRGKDIVIIDNIEFSVTNKGLSLLTKDTLIKIGLLLVDSSIAIKFKERLGLGKRIFERKEINFLNQLEESLKPFNIKGERQYSILSYRIDYYIPSLNIAIEYDENNHEHYTYEQHESRQEEIERELNCKFIRVSDENTNEYNIGYVIKNIFNL